MPAASAPGSVERAAVELLETKGRPAFRTRMGAPDGSDLRHRRKGGRLMAHRRSEGSADGGQLRRAMGCAGEVGRGKATQRDAPKIPYHPTPDGGPSFFGR